MEMFPIAHQSTNWDLLLRKYSNVIQFSMKVWMFAVDSERSLGLGVVIRNALLGKKLKPRQRRLSEMLKKGGNIRHYTRMENNFNKHAVPLTICHDSTWEEKAHMFYVTATSVLGTKVEEKFEMAGTLELDGNCRNAKFDSANYTPQR